MSPETPALSPRDPASIEAWLRLAFVALPARRCRRLLARYGGPQEALQAAERGRTDELLQISGITPNVVERLQESVERDLAPVWRAMQEHQIRLLLAEDDEYPPALRALGEDAPPYIFVRGTIQESDRQAVAIVGTRAASEYGRGLAERLGSDLARRGITVVSGLARGIDTHAHEGALQGGGRTFAVCGCGLDIAYPSTNRDLMSRITRAGAAFSEWAPTTHPESWHFPARNRIISGLSLGIVVLEAGERSGALITAEFAVEQGREVFAVPGNVHRPGSRGPHALIRQGATLVENVDDIIQALNSRSLPFEAPADHTPVYSTGDAGTTPQFTKRAAGQRATKPTKRSAAPDTLFDDNGETIALSNDLASRENPKEVGIREGMVVPASLPSAPSPDLTPEQNAVYGALDEEPRHLDEVAARANVGAAEATATLVLLELRSLARRHTGALFSRAF